MYIFPFAEVPYGSKIVLYGAGYVGNIYLGQILASHYCEVLFAVDRQYQKYVSCKIPVYAPDKLRFSDFDFIVIALKPGSVQGEVYGFLLRMGIPQEKIIAVKKIVSDHYYFGLKSVSKLESGVTAVQNMATRMLRSVRAYDFSELAIAIDADNSLGDAVIGKKIFDVIVQMVPDCRFDLYESEQYRGIARTVYFGEKNVTSVVDGRLSDEERKQYALAYMPSEWIHILYFDEEITRRYSPVLADGIHAIQLHLKEWLSGRLGTASGDYAILLAVERGRLLGMNRYTSMDCQGCLGISDQVVQLYLNPAYLSAYVELGFKRPFITINYGCNLKGVPIGRASKLWPLEHYEKLIRLLKKQYPRIQVVQLGGKNAPHIQGADAYVLGKPLEVVEYILRDSLFHLDGEGGLVHLATQLGTKCIVLFGPTTAAYYGYEQNINITGTDCDGHCGYLGEGWRCVRKLSSPLCMDSILPETVMGNVSRYIEEMR